MGLIFYFKLNLQLDIVVEIPLSVELGHQLSRVHSLLNVTVSLQMTCHNCAGLCDCLDTSFDSLSVVNPSWHLQGSVKNIYNIVIRELSNMGGSNSSESFQSIIV